MDEIQDRMPKNYNKYNIAEVKIMNLISGGAHM